METNRRKFVQKACLGAAGLCGFTQMVKASSGITKQPNDGEKRFMQSWIYRLLENLSTNQDATEHQSILKNCSASHYEYLEMDNLLKPYEGNLKKFNTFLEEQWGWKIDYQKDRSILMANENKDVCVCPLVNQQKNIKMSGLCYCSEGFAERMFSKVVGHQVKARVLTSIQRGDACCRYEIKLA